MRLCITITFAVLLLGVSLALASPLDDGNAAFGAGDSENAVKFWRESAEGGNAVAESNLCAAYYYGDGVTADLKEAMKWCREAATKGDIAAELFFATLYEEGEVVKRDEAQAAIWYERAANEGDLYSQARMGSIYSTGAGVKKDAIQAYKWLRVASDANEKYYGWRAVVNEITSHKRAVVEDIDRDINKLANSMTPEEIENAEKIATDWESAFRAAHPVKKKVSPLLFFAIFLCPALAMSSIPGRQQRFHFGIRVTTWAVVSLLFFVPWFIAWSRGENLQNSPDSWLRAFEWTGFLMLLISYLMKRCSSEAVTFFDGLMFSINSFGASRLHVLVAAPLFIVIIFVSLILALFNELTRRPSLTAVQFHRFIGFFYKHRHDQGG